MQVKLKNPIHLHDALNEVNVSGGSFTFGTVQSVPDPDGEEGATKEVKSAGSVSINIGPPPGKHISIKISAVEEAALEAIVRRGLDKLG